MDMEEGGGGGGVDAGEAKVKARRVAQVEQKVYRRGGRWVWVSDGKVAEEWSWRRRGRGWVQHWEGGMVL